jgi:hypothetical protein
MTKSGKNITLKDCDAKRATMLAVEIGKVRCWLTGFRAARGESSGPPGEDALRQIQVILKNSIK